LLWHGKLNWVYVEHMDVILWACEHDWWTHEHGQVNKRESFQEYFVDVDGIFSEVEEYSTTCHGWTIFLNAKWMQNRMDELSNKHWQQNCFCENLNKRNKME